MPDAFNHFNQSLPEWVHDALREPVVSGTGAEARIMDRVLLLPAPRRRSVPMRPSRWIRRGMLAPVGGAMTTVLLALVVVFRFGVGGGEIANLETVTRVLGDSVVPASVLGSGVGYGLGAGLGYGLKAGAQGTSVDDGQGSSRLLDTLRIVEFVLRGTSVHAASVLGDFNAWRRGATPMVTSGDGEWHTRVLVPRDVVSVAYWVNDARLVVVGTVGGGER